MSKKTLKTVKSSKLLKKISNKITPSSFRAPTTGQDIKSAVLLVSVTINLAVFIGWLLLRLTTVYDAQVYNYLFNR
mgnify:CR=1 FL=1